MTLRSRATNNKARIGEERGMQDGEVCVCVGITVHTPPIVELAVCEDAQHGALAGVHVAHNRNPHLREVIRLRTEPHAVQG